MESRLVKGMIAVLCWAISSMVVADTEGVGSMEALGVNAPAGSINATEGGDVCVPPGPGEVDLQVTSTSVPMQVVAGSGPMNLVHTVVLTNLGTGTATGIVLSHASAVAAGVVRNSMVPTAGTFDPAIWNWTLPSLAGGSSATLTWTYTVPSGVVPGPVFMGVNLNPFITEIDQADTCNTNNTMNVFTPILREVDIQIAGVESIDPVVSGSGAGNLTHSYTLTNLGPSDATGLAASGTYTFPIGVTPDSVSPSVGTWSGTNPGTWTIGNLVAGGSATLTITFTAGNTAAPGTDVINSSVGVSALTEPDPNAGNDQASEATSIVALIDVALSSTESIDPVIAGSGAGNLTQVVSVVNNGPADATNLVIATDHLIPGVGVTLDSGVPSVGTWDELSPGSWSIPALASGATATLTITYTVAPDAGGENEISLSASFVSADQMDTDAGNNTTSVTTEIDRQAELSVSWAESVDPVVAGSGDSNLIHTLTITNNGPSNATGVEWSGTITAPDGVAFASGPSPQGVSVEHIEGGVVLDIGGVTSVINAGGSYFVYIPLTADSSAPVGTDTIVSEVQVTASPDNDPDPGNNSAQIETSIERQIDLAVTKTDDPDPVVAGFEENGLEYVVTVTNNGPSDGDAVVINDPQSQLPAGVVLESWVESAGSYDGTDWVVDLANGATETLTMSVTVGPTAAVGDDAISNTAAVSGSGGNETIINSGDDSHTETTSVLPTTASWTVSKDFLDDSGASVTASLNCSSGDVSTPVQVFEGTTGELTVEGFLMGPFGTTSCEVTETLPPDYLLVSSSADCEVEGFVHEDAFNCDFVNAPIQATFRVTKDFSDDNPAAVRVAIECNTGLPLQQEAMISEFGAPFDQVDFIVRDFEPGQIDCEVFEAPVPGGYLQSYAASDNPDSLYGDISDDENGCYFDAVESGTFDCAITNTLLPVDVTVNKQWIDEHPEYLASQAVNITLRCANGEIEFGYGCGGDECLEAFIDPNNPGVFSVLPGWDGTTSCSASEEPEAGVLQDIGDCESIPLEPGTGGECTIVNTRLYAGIPTLNQYGVAILALLMLSIGLFSHAASRWAD